MMTHVQPDLYTIEAGRALNEIAEALVSILTILEDKLPDKPEPHECEAEKERNLLKVEFGTTLLLIATGIKGLLDSGENEHTKAKELRKMIKELEVRGKEVLDHGEKTKIGFWEEVRSDKA